MAFPVNVILSNLWVFGPIFVRLLLMFMLLFLASVIDYILNWFIFAWFLCALSPLCIWRIYCYYYYYYKRCAHGFLFTYIIRWNDFVDFFHQILLWMLWCAQLLQWQWYLGVSRSVVNTCSVLREILIDCLIYVCVLKEASILLSYWYIITFAKEVMFLPDFVCLFVCLLAR